MKLKFHNADGSPAGEREFAIPAFEGDTYVALLKQAVVGYQANRRQGTSKTKNYGEVAGSGKKIIPQKGSGGARHGDKRAPQLYKGGVVFGPRPRDWSKDIPVTQRRKALGRALFDLATAGGLSVIERFEVSKPKTKVFSGILNKVNPAARKLLLVDASWSEPVRKASRNIARAKFSNSTNLNALDLVRHGQVVITEQALLQVIARATN
ncbi:MAG TPA: 50S ribosomal protein L4 [Opitutae bacterium]|jgi:large subunit ribosomal protein L4|nr:50S ribosomal protein L4 [Opitutae bacterium]